MFVSLIGIFAFASCTSSDDYEMAEKLSGEQVYFPGTLAQKVNLKSTENTYNVSVMRVNTTGEITVPLAVEYEGEALTIPTSVTFHDGETEASLSIAYDAEKLGFDNYESATIAIANDEYTTIYGATSYTCSFGIPAPWTSLGKGKYNDSFFMDNFYTVEIQQNDIDPQLFRIVDPYGIGMPNEGFEIGQTDEYMQIRIFKAGETYMDEVLAQDIVVFGKGLQGIDITTGWSNPTYNDEVFVLHPSRFTSMSTQDAWVYSYVSSYQENGLPATIVLSPYYYMFNTGGWNYTDKESIQIVFPGVELKDYSVTVDYIGKYYDADDNVYAVANVELGADVASAKAGLVEGADPADLVNGLVDGSIEGVDAVNGEVKIAMPENAASGKYTIAVVSYDESGEAQEYDYVTFKYTNLSAPVTEWDLTKTLVGDYEYVQMWEGTDAGLTLTPKGNGVFTISDWGYGVDFTFTLHADNTVTFDDFFTGYTHDSYGDVMLADLGQDEEEESSYYDPSEGVFYFNTYYFVEAGYFGYGPETFTITGYAPAGSKAAKAKAKKHMNLSAPGATSVRLSAHAKHGKVDMRYFSAK